MLYPIDMKFSGFVILSPAGCVLSIEFFDKVHVLKVIRFKTHRILLSCVYTHQFVSPICVATALREAWSEHEQKNSALRGMLHTPIYLAIPLRHKLVCVAVALVKSNSSLLIVFSTFHNSLFFKNSLVIHFFCIPIPVRIL